MRNPWFRVVATASLLGMVGIPVVQASDSDTASCAHSTAAVLAEYRAASPLLATDAAHTLRVTLRADGCVATVLPLHYVRPGLHVERLGGRELALLRHQLASTELVQFDAAALREKSLRAKRAIAAGEVRSPMRVYDEDIIEIALFPALAPKRFGTPVHIHWTSLRNDLFAMPDERALVALGAAQRIFVELAERHLSAQAAQ